MTFPRSITPGSAGPNRPAAIRLSDDPTASWTAGPVRSFLREDRAVARRKGGVRSRLGGATFRARGGDLKWSGLHGRGGEVGRLGLHESRRGRSGGCAIASGVRSPVVGRARTLRE